MKELDVDELVNMNYRLCTLLGIAAAIVSKPKMAKVDKDWFMRAIQAVVYEKKPLPEFPE